MNYILDPSKLLLLFFRQFLKVLLIEQEYILSFLFPARPEFFEWDPSEGFRNDNAPTSQCGLDTGAHSTDDNRSVPAEKKTHLGPRHYS